MVYFYNSKHKEIVNRNLTIFTDWRLTVANDKNNQNNHDPDHDTSQVSQQDDENQADDHGYHQTTGEGGHIRCFNMLL